MDAKTDLECPYCGEPKDKVDQTCTPCWAIIGPLMGTGARPGQIKLMIEHLARTEIKAALVPLYHRIRELEAKNLVLR